MGLTPGTARGGNWTPGEWTIPGASTPDAITEAWDGKPEAGKPVEGTVLGVIDWADVPGTGPDAGTNPALKGGLALKDDDDGGGTDVFGLLMLPWWSGWSGCARFPRPTGAGGNTLSSESTRNLDRRCPRSPVHNDKAQSRSSCFNRCRKPWMAST